jgi:hypothetical protein
MADIIAWGDKHKKLIKIADGWLRRKIGASVDVVHKDLSNCGNPVFFRIAKILNKAADYVDTKYQQKIIRDYGELFLWIMYKDTAYRDPAFWILYQLLDNAEVIKKELEPYVKEPEDWYVNCWNRSKINTAKGRKDGRIPNNRKSFDESIFTPPEQLQKLKKYRGDK